MFVVTEADAAAIRAIFSREGELSAAIGAAPAISWDHRQHEGAGIRAEHRRVDAAPSPVIRLRPGKDA
jgi:hypothetical protein